MEKLFKIISVILIQTFLMLDFAWCGESDICRREKDSFVSNLAPHIRMGVDSFEDFFTNPPPGRTRNQNITFELSDYEPILQDKIKRMILSDSGFSLKELLQKAGQDFDINKLQKIKIGELPSHGGADFWYVLKVDFEFSDGKILEAVCKILKPQTEDTSLINMQKELEEVLKAHRVFDGSGEISQLYSYNKFDQTDILFVEYVPDVLSDEIKNLLSKYKQFMRYRRENDERYITVFSKEDIKLIEIISRRIAENAVELWYRSSADSEKRFIFMDGHNWERGNARFYRNKEGKIDVKFVDVGNHVEVDSPDVLANIASEPTLIEDAIGMDFSEKAAIIQEIIDERTKTLKTSEVEETSGEKNSVTEMKLTRRGFFQIIGGSAIALGFNLVLPGEGLPQTTAVQENNSLAEFKDLIMSVDKQEFFKYSAVIDESGLINYADIKTKGNATTITIRGVFPLNAEQLKNDFNTSFSNEGLRGRFTLKKSTADWEESLPYRVIENTALKIVAISETRGLGNINPQDLIDIFEGITFVESKFRHWQEDVVGRRSPLKSETGAVGVTQLVESQAVEQVIRWILTYKGGIDRYAEILRELERVIKAPEESTEEANASSVYADLNEFIRLTNRRANTEGKQLLVRKIRDKLFHNEKLIGVNLYYALATWLYVATKDKPRLKIGLTEKIAKEIADIAEKMEIVQSGEGAYKPENFAKAKLQFNREYLRANMIYFLIGEDTIKNIVGIANAKQRYKTLKQYFRKKIRNNKVYNQIIGYTYASILWDRARRLRLVKEKKGYDFIEELPDNLPKDSHGFSVSLKTAAEYNAGRGVVDAALRLFGTEQDKKDNIPLWIKQMAGVNRHNPREPINYIRMFLEYALQYKGELTAEKYTIMSGLIEERYKRIFKRKGRLIERYKFIKRGKAKIYAEAPEMRTDNFDYRLASLLATILGSDYVDSFLMSYDLPRRWEEKIFNSNTPTFDNLAGKISDSASPYYQTGKSLIEHLNKRTRENKGSFSATLALLTQKINEFKARQKSNLFRREILRRNAERQRAYARRQKIWGFIRQWGIYIGKGSLIALVTGGIGFVIYRRIKRGAKLDRNRQKPTIRRQTQTRIYTQSRLLSNQRVVGKRSILRRIVNAVFRRIGSIGGNKYLTLLLFAVGSWVLLNPSNLWAATSFLSSVSGGSVTGILSFFSLIGTIGWMIWRKNNITSGAEISREKDVSATEVIRQGAQRRQGNIPKFSNEPVSNISEQSKKEGVLFHKVFDNISAEKDFVENFSYEWGSRLNNPMDKRLQAAGINDEKLRIFITVTIHGMLENSLYYILERKKIEESRAKAAGRDYIFPGQIELSIRYDGKTIIVEIKDNSIGMSSFSMENIRKPKEIEPERITQSYKWSQSQNYGLRIGGYGVFMAGSIKKLTNEFDGTIIFDSLYKRNAAAKIESSRVVINKNSSQELVSEEGTRDDFGTTITMLIPYVIPSIINNNFSERLNEKNTAEQATMQAI